MLRKIKLHVVICVLSLCCYDVFSQKEYSKFHFTPIKENFSKIGVSTIIQDHYGFIWIGTNGMGLYKYDGIDYVNYKHILTDSTSISSSLVHCSYLDSKNRLWIGTEGGLSLYDHNYDRFVRVPISLNCKEKNAITSIRSLAEDRFGNLFIGTIDLGLYKLNLDSFKIKKVIDADAEKDAYINVNAITINHDGEVFLGTSNGLKSYDYESNTISNKLLTAYCESSGILDPIKSLIIDSKNNLWIGTFTKGLHKLTKMEADRFKFETFLISENAILSMMSLFDETILCGTENSGLFHLDENGTVLNNYLSVKTDEKSILSNSIWALFEDTEKRIWIGYYNRGVGVYDKLYDKFKNIESLHNDYNSLQAGSIYGIAQEDKNHLWVCSDGGGIDIFNTKTNKITHINSSDNKAYQGLTSDYLQVIFIDSKKNIWAGSWNKGLFFLKKGTKKFINYNRENTNGGLQSNTILSIAEDANGVIWIGTFYKGLHAFNPNTGEIKHYNTQPFLDSSIASCDIRKVLIDSNNDLWVGTTTLGLFKITGLKTGDLSIKSLADAMSRQFEDHASTNHILSIYESRDKTLWIGTRGAGLCKYNQKKEEFNWFNETNGLQEENISAITESLSGDIWMSGNSGLTRLHVAINTFKNFTSDDGLLSDDFNMNAVFNDGNGNLYFGNYRGIDYFNPSTIATNTSYPSLYFTDFKLFNKKVIPNQDNSPLEKVISETKHITLNKDQSVFTIEYSGINYTRPEKNTYAYYLEGYEETWNYVGKNRSATYTNLDPGHYIFKLKAANNDGIWNETPLTLDITVLPPFWKTNWAIAAYLLCFLFGLYLLNVITKSRIKEKQKISYERRKREQDAELNERKFQFFTNISHEFRTPLSLIMSPLEDVIQDKSLKLPSRVREKHNIIHKNTNRLYRLINELLDFRKLELDKVNIKARQLNLVHFTKEVVSHFKEEAFTRNIKLSVDADVLELAVWADESMLEKIIFNLLSNAMKVTPEGGNINIELVSRDDTYQLPLIDEEKPTKGVEIRVSDTGPGLEKDQVDRIFERFYQVKNMNRTYYGGTGIGLEVVQNFVKLHKGKVEVVSELGFGTTFKVILPSGNAHFNAHELLSSDVKEEVQKEKFVLETISKGKDFEVIQTEKIETQSYTLLIVEDNTELRNYLKEELKDHYKILTASHGKEGIEVAKSALPDIIITDIIMPEMDGFGFCKTIKSDIKTSHIPLLMLTAKTKVDDRMEGIEKGADAYMVKPFNMRLLKLRLSQLITSRQLIFNKYFSVISDVPKNKNTTSLDKEFIQKVLSYINENLGDPDLNVEVLASQLNLSRSQFYRKIKALTNQTANEFLRNIRLQRAKQIIETGNANISEVCYKIGFSSPSYFTKCFKSYFGVLPTEVSGANRT